MKRPVCSICGSHKVELTTQAEWCASRQEWEIADARSDRSVCHCCGAEDQRFKWIDASLPLYQVIMLNTSDNYDEQPLLLASVYATDRHEAVETAKMQVSICAPYHWGKEDVNVLCTTLQEDIDAANSSLIAL